MKRISAPAVTCGVVVALLAYATWNYVVNGAQRDWDNHPHPAAATIHAGEERTLPSLGRTIPSGWTYCQLPYTCGNHRVFQYPEVFLVGALGMTPGHCFTSRPPNHVTVLSADATVGDRYTLRFDPSGKELQVCSAHPNNGDKIVIWSDESHEVK